MMLPPPVGENIPVARGVPPERRKEIWGFLGLFTVG